MGETIYIVTDSREKRVKTGHCGGLSEFLASLSRNPESIEDFERYHMSITGEPFYDGGNIYNKTSRPAGESIPSVGYTNTIGVGFRFKTPVGPLRFDVGRNLNPLPGQASATQFFITLGQAF